jgi:hypothetical protein
MGEGQLDYVFEVVSRGRHQKHASSRSLKSKGSIEVHDLAPRILLPGKGGEELLFLDRRFSPLGNKICQRLALDRGSHGEVQVEA